MNLGKQRVYAQKSQHSKYCQNFLIFICFLLKIQFLVLIFLIYVVIILLVSYFKIISLIMNDAFPRTKKLHYKPTSKPLPSHQHSHKRTTACLPKAQPDIAPYQMYGHPRKGKQNLKSRQNDAQVSSSKDIRVKNNPLYQSGITRGEESHLKRTQKRVRQDKRQDKRQERKGRTQMVSVEEQLQCQQELSGLNAQIYKQKNPNANSRPNAETQICRLDDSQKLIRFDKMTDQLRWEEQAELLKGLVKRQEQYSRSKNYVNYLTVQPQLTWKRRALVLDWMMLLASQLNCRRQTFSNSVNILDRYLGLKSGVMLDHLQCIGAVALLIAQKLQDSSRMRAYSFYAPISQKHSLDQFLDLQIQMSITLGFKLRAPTVNSWANRLAVQWDLYVDSVQCQKQFSAVRFKAADSQSYINFRWLTQYIDFSLLDIQTLQYKNRTLAAAFLYLTLLIRLQIHSAEQIAQQFRTISKHILANTPFNHFFSQFLMDSFEFPLKDILPAVQYCSIFVILPVSFEFPKLIDERVMSFEEYCGIQTYNQMSKTTIQRLDRNWW